MTTPFSNHRIVSRVQAEGFESWLLKSYCEARNGWKSEFWVRITSADRLLTVTGDFEPTVFAYGGSSDPVSNVYWIGRHKTVDSYVFEKACIGTRRESVTEYDTEAARNELENFIKEANENAEKYPDEQEYYKNLAKAYQAGLDTYENYDGILGIHEIRKAVLEENPDLWEELGGLGERPSSAVYLALQALNRLVELLDAETAKTSAQG
jgi:hypothetical protein